MCELLLDAPEPALKSLDNRELSVNRQPEHADLRRLGGRDVFVELLDEADDRVRAFPVEFLELLTREHRAITSRGRNMGAPGRAGK